MRHLGTRRNVTQEDLEDLIMEAREQLTRAGELTDRRDQALDSLLARTGNGLHGIRHRRKGEEQRPKPFAGAADNRVRWSDHATDCMVSLIMEALSAAELHVVPVGGQGAEARAEALTRLARWCVGAMGSAWDEQLELAVRYTLTDSPGVGGAVVGWERRPVRTARRVDVGEVAQALLAALPERTADEVLRLLEDGAAEDDVALLQAAEGYLRADRRTARAVLRALAQDGAAEFLAVTDWEEGPSVRAMRYYDDFLLPSRCEDLAYASPWFRCEWVSAPRLRALAASNGWSRTFVEETLRHEATEFLSFGGDGVGREELRGLYQLVYAYEAETDEDGCVLRWQTVFSAAKGVTACGRELLRGRKGGWPAVIFRRERLNRMLLQSRGLAEVAAPEQEAAKHLCDVAANNALIGGLPPVVSRGVRGALKIRSLDVIRLQGVNSEVKFMQPPAYPAQANAEVQRLRDSVYEYLGLATKGGDSEILGVRRRKLVKLWMNALQDLLGAVLSLAQANASDALLAEILGRVPDDPSLRRDIAGSFTLRLEVNPEDLFAKNVIEKVQALGQVLGQMDRQRAVDTTPLALRVTRVLFPDVSEAMIRTPRQLGEAELRDEEDNYLRIRAGLRPRMDTAGGWDYAARLGFWERLAQEQPEALAEMAPEAQAFAQEWVEALRQQARQFGENADLGRTGSEAVEAMG